MRHPLLILILIVIVIAATFSAGLWIGNHKHPVPPPLPPAPEQASPTPTPVNLDSLIGTLLANKDAFEGISFTSVIESSAGMKILPFQPGADPDREILAAVRDALDKTLTRMNAPDSPTGGLRRINEASRFFEDAIGDILNKRPGFSCDYPPNAEGDVQRSGYPDLRLVHEASGRVVYIDPKLFENTSRNSSLRTFYFEPKGPTGKVLDDAHHLLVGIAHDGNDGDWKFLSWHAVDLARFRVRLKAEFQASNKDLYRPELIILSSTP